MKVFSSFLIIMSLGIGGSLSSAEIRFAHLFERELEELRGIVSTGYHAHEAMAEPTPEQTQGPFYPIREPHEVDIDLTTVGNNATAQGLHIHVQGQVFDENGTLVPNATIEIWQACHTGKYNHPGDSNPALVDPNFQYYGKTLTDEKGHYIFKTIVPGPYPVSKDWWRPPHIHVMVKAQGFKKFVTQLYFNGDSFSGQLVTIINGRDIRGEEINDFNREDHILSSLPPRQQRMLTVTFAKVKHGDGTTQLGIFNIYLPRRQI